MYPMPMYPMQSQRAYFPAMTGFRPWQSGPMQRPYGFVPQRNRGPNMPRGVNVRPTNPSLTQRPAPQQRMAQQSMQAGQVSDE